MEMEECCKACPKDCPDIDRQQIADEVRDSAYHVIDAKGATNFAVGLALVKISTSILRDENSVLTVSTRIDGEYGIRGVCLSLPTVLGRGGVDRLICPDLRDAEQAALRSSAEAIKAVQRKVGLP
ncbi:MAG: hypothetical protein A2V70_07865 [Planctomycetes bacterium RBG_13_63_9]|nr:MAG: hypothetical protein A2V70_07865 [Planctomycetes bacterium RBG_13_63_9]